MRRLLTTLALIAALIGGVSWAQQTPARWTAPSGAWSFDYAGIGWTFASPVPDDMRHYDLIVMPIEPPPEGQSRLCTVTELALDVDNPDPATAATTAARLDEDSVRSMYTRRGQTVTRLEHASDSNGVSTADIYSVTRSGTPHRHRIFYVMAGGRVMFTDIDCMWSPTLAPNLVSEIDSLLNSVQINAMSDPR